MKKLIFTMMAMALILSTFSQTINNQGTVTFEEVIKFDIQMDDMSEEMQAMLPKENRTNTVLYFNSSASRYQNLETNEATTIEEESEGGAVKIMISQPENIVYRDLENSISVEQKEFMTRVFLIESKLSTDEWKLTGNQKKILDYPCQEAIKGEGDDLISVWFTPAIPVSSGPGTYGNLPGLVLAMEGSGGDRSIVATSVELKAVDADKLQKPKKGKKVSQEKYEAIVAEKTKEMGGENGEGGATVIMKITQ